MASFVADPLFAFNQLTLLAAVGFGGGLYLFVRGFRLLVRKRLLINTPVSKIRSASLGLVEVNGVAIGPYTLRTPIAATPCFLYRTTAWQKSDESRSGEWKKVAEETLHVPFFLDDGTGQMLIQPQGAELDLHRDIRKDFSDTIFSPHASQETVNFLARHGVAPDDKIRVEECSIQPQSQLFVVGTLSENHGIEVKPFPLMAQETAQDKTSGSRITVGSGPAPLPPPQPTVIRLSAPAAPALPANPTQQAKIAAALTKAGITNPLAWEAADVSPRDVAAAAAPRVSQISVTGNNQPPSPDQPAFDLTPPVVLMKGRNDPSFLISWRSQHDLVRSLAWKSTAMIWLGAGLTLLGIYVVLAQFELL